MRCVSHSQLTHTCIPANKRHSAGEQVALAVHHALLFYKPQRPAASRWTGVPHVAQWCLALMSVHSMFRDLFQAAFKAPVEDASEADAVPISLDADAGASSLYGCACSTLACPCACDSLAGAAGRRRHMAAASHRPPIPAVKVGCTTHELGWSRLFSLSGEQCSRPSPHVLGTQARASSSAHMLIRSPRFSVSVCFKSCHCLFVGLPPRTPASFLTL